MNANLIVIDSDAELVRAHKLVDRLMTSDDPADLARLAAQARLIAGYEQSRWPRRTPSAADVIRYLMDQHRLSRSDMAAILGTESRVSEVLRGRKALSMTMVQRLRARFGVPADVLLPPPGKTKARRARRRKAA
jgi:HTH-type transcriptional regulator/antitoxin HigA